VSLCSNVPPVLQRQPATSTRQVGSTQAPGRMNMSIRPVVEIDAADLARIYNHYVSGTCITFETDPLAAADMSRRMAEAMNAQLPWLVAEVSGAVVGYAYAAKWKGRSAYRYSVESTIYLDAGRTGKGIGFGLYSALLAALRATSMHAVIGGIALPNEPSIRLHERLGFKQVAHFAQVGFKQDHWVDVGYWQLLL
jgi:phosphinothricin acetyltransferase